MGMDYRYAGSSSYPRFNEEMELISQLIETDDIIFTTWIANPYKNLNVKDTKHIYDMIWNYILDNTDNINTIFDYGDLNHIGGIPYQIYYELAQSIANFEGWAVHR